MQLVILAKNQPNAGKHSVPLLQPAFRQPVSLSVLWRTSSSAELTVLILCSAFRAGARGGVSPQKEDEMGQVRRLQVQSPVQGNKVIER